MARLIRCDKATATVQLDERRLYRAVGPRHAKVYVGPGVVEVPLFVAEEWGVFAEPDTPEAEEPQVDNVAPVGEEGEA